MDRESRERLKTWGNHGISATSSQELLNLNRNSDDLEPGTSLLQRLKLKHGQGLDPIPLPLLRKYIAYSRQWCQPK